MPSPYGLFGTGLVLGVPLGVLLTVAVWKHRTFYRWWRRHMYRVKARSWLPPIPVVEAQRFVRPGFLPPRAAGLRDLGVDGIWVEDPLEEAKYVRPRVRCESGHPGARAVRRAAFQVVGRAA